MSLRNVDRWARAVREDVKGFSIPVSVEETFGRYRDDLPGFFTEVLGLKSATRRSTGEEYQLAILRDVQEHPRTVAVCGHGVGKSTTCEAASRNFSMSVVKTFSTWRQIEFTRSFLVAQPHLDCGQRIKFRR